MASRRKIDQTDDGFGQQELVQLFTLSEGH